MQREPSGTVFDPDAVYEDSAVRLALGITSATLSRERNCGRLRYCRKGNRCFYFGRWLLEWIGSDSSKTEARGERATEVSQ